VRTLLVKKWTSDGTDREEVKRGNCVWKWKKCPDVRLAVWERDDSSKCPFAIPSLIHKAQSVLCYIFCACIKVKVKIKVALE